MITFFRDIIGVATDCASFDPGNVNEFPAHQIFLGNDKWGAENVANLDKLPDKGYTIFNMVFKLHEGSGAPTRLYATFGKHDFSGSSIVRPIISSASLVSIIFMLTIFINGI